MNKKGMVLAAFLIFINGCVVGNKECVVDSDCVPAGCSGQLCVSSDNADDIITTCEYKEEYTCLRLTSCGCIENKCQWADTKEYAECLEEVRV